MNLEGSDVCKPDASLCFPGTAATDTAPCLGTSSPAVPAMPSFLTPATAPRSRLALSTTPAPFAHLAAGQEAQHNMQADLHSASELRLPAALSISPPGAAPGAKGNQIRCASEPLDPAVVSKAAYEAAPQAASGAAEADGDEKDSAGAGIAEVGAEESSAQKMDQGADSLAAEHTTDQSADPMLDVQPRLASAQDSEDAAEKESHPVGSCSAQEIALTPATATDHTTSTLAGMDLNQERLLVLESGTVPTAVGVSNGEAICKPRTKSAGEGRRSVMDVLVDARLQPDLFAPVWGAGNVLRVTPPASRSQSPEGGVELGTHDLPKADGPVGLGVGNAVTGCLPALAAKSGQPNSREPSIESEGVPKAPRATGVSLSSALVVSHAPWRAAKSGLSALLFSRPQQGESQGVASSVPISKAPAIGIRMDALLGIMPPAKPASACQAVPPVPTSSPLLGLLPIYSQGNQQPLTTSSAQALMTEPGIGRGIQQPSKQACFGEDVVGDEGDVHGDGSSPGTLFAPVAMRPETTAALLACQASLQNLVGRIHSGPQVSNQCHQECTLGVFKI